MMNAFAKAVKLREPACGIRTPDGKGLTTCFYAGDYSRAGSSRAVSINPRGFNFADFLEDEGGSGVVEKLSRLQAGAWTRTDGPENIDAKISANTQPYKLLPPGADREILHQFESCVDSAVVRPREIVALAMDADEIQECLLKCRVRPEMLPVCDRKGERFFYVACNFFVAFEYEADLQYKGEPVKLPDDFFSRAGFADFKHHAEHTSVTAEHSQLLIACSLARVTVDSEGKIIKTISVDGSADTVPDGTVLAEPNRCKRALLIGVDEYTDADIKDLPVCLSDVAQVGKQLLKHGFDPKDIRVLSCTQTKEIATVSKHWDGEPTRDNILDALHKLAWVTGPTDEVLVYFSGYGSKCDRGAVADPAATIVTSDSGRGDRESKDISQANFFSRVQQIARRSKYTTLLMEACGTGGAVRYPDQDGPLARGPNEVFCDTPAERHFEERVVPSGKRWASDVPGFADTQDCLEWDFAYAVACGSKQFSCDAVTSDGPIFSAGVWTLNLVRALQDQPGTMHDFLAAACSNLDNCCRQSPLFSPGSNRALFSMVPWAGEPYVPIRNCGGEARIPLGTCHGVTEDMRFQVVSPHSGSRTGVKVNAKKTYSVLRLDDPGQMCNGMARVSDLGFAEGIPRVCVVIESGVTGWLVSTYLFPRLCATPFGRLVQLKTEKDGNKLRDAQVSIAGGNDECTPLTFTAFGVKEDAPQERNKTEWGAFWDAVCLKVCSFAKYAFGIHVLQVRLPMALAEEASVKMVMRSAPSGESRDFQDVLSETSLSHGDKLRIRVRNETRKSLHLQVLEFSEHGSVNLLHPFGATQDSSTGRVDWLDETHWLCFSIDYHSHSVDWPFSTFCAVASTVPADFSALFREVPHGVHLKKCLCEDDVYPDQMCGVQWSTVRADSRKIEKSDIPGFFPVLQNTPARDTNPGPHPDSLPEKEPLESWSCSELHDFIAKLDIDDAGLYAERIAGGCAPFCGKDVAQLLNHGGKEEMHKFLASAAAVTQDADRQRIISSLQEHLSVDGDGKRFRVDEE